MQRLKIAQLQIKSYMSDRLALRACDQEEIASLARLREALALIAEAEFHAGSVDVRRWKEPGWPEKVA